MKYHDAGASLYANGSSNQSSRRATIHVARVSTSGKTTFRVRKRTANRLRQRAAAAAAAAPQAALARQITLCSWRGFVSNRAPPSSVRHPGPFHAAGRLSAPPRPLEGTARAKGRPWRP